MATMRTRAGKGSALSHNELDANFSRSVTQKTTTYQILLGDNRAIIEGNHASTPFVITLPPVATADNAESDFEVTVTNINVAVVTLDGSGAEAVDGGTGVTLKQWDSVTVGLDSALTSWKTLDRVGDLGDIDVGTVTASGDTAAGDLATMGYAAADGAIITGQGSTSDVTIKNDVDGTVISVPTGTTIAKLAGGLLLTERADHEATPATGFGEVWMDSSDSPPNLKYTDEDGSDYVLARTVQLVNVQDGASTNGTTTIPLDDTIPQNTEGDEVMTLAITPIKTANKLKIDVVVQFSCSSASNPAAALFQDATAGALACGAQEWNQTSALGELSFTHYMTAGTEIETTFKVRLGGTAGTMYFNGNTSGRRYGGVLASSITITEINV
jgi:hypothetical protein